MSEGLVIVKFLGRQLATAREVVVADYPKRQTPGLLSRGGFTDLLDAREICFQHGATNVWVVQGDVVIVTRCLSRAEKPLQPLQKGQLLLPTGKRRACRRGQRLGTHQALLERLVCCRGGYDLDIALIGHLGEVSVSLFY